MGVNRVLTIGLKDAVGSGIAIGKLSFKFNNFRIAYYDSCYLVSV